MRRVSVFQAVDLTHCRVDAIPDLSKFMQLKVSTCDRCFISLAIVTLVNLLRSYIIVNCYFQGIMFTTKLISLVERSSNNRRTHTSRFIR